MTLEFLPPSAKTLGTGCLILVLAAWGVDPTDRGSRALGQTTTPDSMTLAALNERVNTFLSALGDRSTARRAVEQMVQGGPLERQANTTKLIEQVEQFSTRYGIHLESERIVARQVGQDLILLTYLYKTDQFPVIWRFTFYRPRTRTVDPSPWRIVAISFDTNYQQLLDLPLDADSPRNNP